MSGNTKHAVINKPHYWGIGGVIILLAAVAYFAYGHQFLGFTFAHSDQEQATETIYTCPMHPQIVETEEGTCPICGMDLVEKEIARESSKRDHDGHDHAVASTKVTKASDATFLYTCPMHPQIVEEKPGTCPICAMDLVPLKNVPEQPASGDLGKPAITIDPVVVQNMGVRLAQVARAPVFRHIRAIGEVEVAEDEISVVNMRFSGWVERIWVDQTGQHLKKGQWLFQIYSPEVIGAQEELLLAHKAYGANHQLTKAAQRRLELLNIPGRHIKRVLKTGDGQLRLVVTAPRGGYVLEKNVVLGARANAGQDLYRIGNLGRIWVKAEVYEFDAPWVKVGQMATMELSFNQGQTLAGKVVYLYPTYNERARTLTVRLEFSNPGLQLRPGMFATVRIEAQRKEDVLTVPTEAVLYSGERRLVFVSAGQGKYEPREVVVGLAGDNRRTEILSGLAEHENIVVSGQFLIDSESQLQEAVQKMLADRLQVRQSSPNSAGQSEQPSAHNHQH